MLGLLLAACAPDRGDDPNVTPSVDLTGTWEVVDEGDQPLSRAGQRYTFAADSTLRIFRPRSLGPASTIFAVYDFIGDTLAIRSEFDAEYLLPELRNDTLVLHPVGAGRALTLVHIGEGETAPPPPQPAPPGADGDYVPPGDLPPEQMPQN